MIVKITWKDAPIDRWECKDVGMCPGGVVVKINDTTDIIVPFTNVYHIEVQKDPDPVLRRVS